VRPDGLAVLDKPAGMTSHDVVDRCRKVLGCRRVGHAGTLDPDATGVLLVGVGRVTRLMRYLSGLRKTYLAQVVLGTATDTYDSSGRPCGSWDMSEVTLEQARRATRELSGRIVQVPPMVSALKVGGRRLHELAREGLEVERKGREVEVYRFELNDCELRGGVPDPGAGWGRGPVFEAVVECSSGTYVRSLAHDLGRLLQGGAHIRCLRRTAVGPFGIEDAVSLDALGPEHLLPARQVLPWMQEIHLDAEAERLVRHGRALVADERAGHGTGPWRLVGEGGDLLAVYESDGQGGMRPGVVLAGS
jgi:tRNA pseudouridine55 synthase